MTKHVTIVVPFYNEVAFIENAINSILSQGIDGIEVIIVNDNPDIFHRDFFDNLNFPTTDVRVLHHTENMGLSQSRNTGISAANGTYIGFLDSDDYYLPKGLSSLVQWASESGAEFTHGQCIITRINNPYGRVPPVEIRNFGNKDIYNEDLKNKCFDIISSWSILYSLEFLKNNNIIFDSDQRKYEDRLFIVDSVLAATKVAVLGQPTRIWRKRPDSITTSQKSLSEASMKLSLFEKCVSRWQEAHIAGHLSSSFASRELIRHSKNIVFANDISYWLDPANNSGNSEIINLNTRVSELLSSQHITEADVEDAFPESDGRRGTDTGNGQITPADLYEYIRSISEKRFDVAAAIVERANRPPSTVRNSTTAGEAPPVRESLENIDFIVHVGLHKTGSTFIQKQLEANRSLLRKHGVLFPETGFGFFGNNIAVRSGGVPGHQALLRATQVDNRDLKEELHREIVKSGCRTVILSMENLSMPMADAGQRRNAIIRLLAALRSSRSPRVVAMVRRPDKWLDSLYREQVSNGGQTGYQSASEFFLNNGSILSLPELFEPFEDVTGNAVRVGSFDDAIAGPGLLPAFLDLCRIRDIDADDLIIQEDTRYPSPCNAQIAIARMVTAEYRDVTARQNVLRTFFHLTRPTSQNAPLLSRNERRNTIQTFLDQSADFLSERGVVCPGDEWLASTEHEAEATAPEIPMHYVEVLTQQAIWSRGRPGSYINRPLPSKNKPAPAQNKSAPAQSKPAPTQSKPAPTQNRPTHHLPQNLEGTPRPIRWFANSYRLLTHHSMYRPVRLAIRKLMQR